MATKLKNLVITKVALVDEGACSAAHIKLFKRKEGGQPIMNEETLLKLIPEDQREDAKTFIEKAKMDLAALAAKKAEDAKDKGVDDALENPDGSLKSKDKSVAKLAEKLVALNADLSKAKNPAAQSDEEIMKSLDPGVRAMIEKANAKSAIAEAMIIKMRDDAEDVEVLAKAKELTNIGAEETELVKYFKEIKKSNPAAFDNIFAVLKAADALIADGSVMGEIGSTNSSVDDITLEKNKNDAWDKIEKKATEIEKSMTSIIKEAAIAKAIKDNPDLYTKYVNNLKLFYSYHSHKYQLIIHKKTYIDLIYTNLCTFPVTVIVPFIALTDWIAIGASPTL